MASFAATEESTTAMDQPPPESAGDLAPETMRGVGRDMLATMARLRGEAEKPQVNPMLATVMIGNALAANRANEKRISEKAGEIDSKQKVTLNADGTVDVKGMAGADFVATAKTQSAGTLAGVYAVLERFGVAPKTKPDDKTFDDDLTYEELVDIGRRVRGWDERKAKQEANRAMKDPVVRKRALQWIKDNYSQNLIDRYGAVKPVLDEEQRRVTEERQQTNLDRQFANDAENRKQYDAAEDTKNWKEFYGSTLPYLGSIDAVLAAANESGFKITPGRESLLKAKYQKDQKAVADAEAAERRRVEDQEMQRAAAARQERMVAELAAGRMDQRTFNQEMKKLTFERDTGVKYAKEVERYVKIDESFAKVEALANTGTGAADYTLLLSFVHGVDDTAAREGEVKIAQSTVDLVTQARQMLNKWRTGQLLDPKMRANFVGAAKAMRDAVRPFREKIDQRYRKLAEKGNLDTEVIGLPSEAPKPTHKYVPGKGLVKVQ
jgi:hypothetical protein